MKPSTNPALSPASAATHRHRRLILAVIATLLVAALAAGAWKGWRAARLGLALREDLRALEAVAEDGPGFDSIASLGPQLSAAREHAVSLRSETAVFLPVTRLLGWVPVYGADLEAAGPLLDLAAGLTTAADESYTALSPLLIDRDVRVPLTAAFVDRLVTERQRLASAREALGQASEAMGQIPLDRLSPWTRDRLRRVDDLLPLVEGGLDLVLTLPELLGANGPRTYLLLAQNEDELRATGGFISGAGVVTFDSGRMTEFRIGDSYDVDDLAAHPYPSPPEPLLRYMMASIWVFRDSNWSPDFPASARMASALYELGQGQTVDGVIAFDQTAIRMLLEAIGPVTVEGTPGEVSSSNVVDYMRAAWSPAPGQGLTAEWWEGRKEFMGRLGKAILVRLESDASGLDPLALARAAERLLDERHVLVNVKEPSAARALAERGWDGALRPGTGDFLMVVDSNVGFNKVNPVIRESIDYSVDLSDPAGPIATVTVRHAHTLSDPAVECRHAPDYGTGEYADMTRRCYWDYLRVFFPGAAEPLDSAVEPVPGEWILGGVSDGGAVDFGAGEAGTSTLGALVVVPLGGGRQTSFRYRLPATVLADTEAGRHYHLALQKQPGTDSVTVTVRVTLPPGAALASASPPPTTVSGQTVTFEIDLVEDRTVELVFR